MQQTTLTAATTTTHKVGVVIGLDLGDRWSRCCVLDDAGAVLEEDRLRSHAEGAAGEVRNSSLHAGRDRDGNALTLGEPIACERWPLCSGGQCPQAADDL